MSQLRADDLETKVDQIFAGLPLPARGATLSEADAELHRWCWRNKRQIRAAVAAALDALPVEPRERDAPRSRDELRAYLDDTPPTASARAVIRPPAPMTLGDVRRMLDMPAPNPAPLSREKRSSGVRYPQVTAPGEYGEMWSISAPEGFPPYPRRGTEYNQHEAGVVSGWLSSIWPAYQELLLYASQRDRELMRAGADMRALNTMLAGHAGHGAMSAGHALRRFVESDIGQPTTGTATGYFGDGYPRTEYATTPRAVVEKMEDYARQYIGPALRLLDNMRDAGMIAKKNDPEEIDAQVEWAKRAGLRPDAIWRLYIGHQHRSDTVKPQFFPEPWRTRLARVDEKHIHLAPDLKTPDGTPVPLSAQIAAEQSKRLDYERQYKDRQQAQEAAAALLREDLRAMKGITRPALEARGWTVTNYNHVERAGVVAWFPPNPNQSWTHQLRAWAGRGA